MDSNAPHDSKEPKRLIRDIGQRNSQQRGPFTDMVTNAPSSAASLLRRFHKQKNPNRFHLITDIGSCEFNPHSGYISHDQINAFLSSGLPIVLMDIACEGSLYKRWGQDAFATVSAR